MISISRALALQFRAVARRAGLSKVGLPGSGCVRLLASADLLRLQATNGRVAVECQAAGKFDAADITVPLQVFADCEAKTDGLVTIRRSDSAELVASWDDRGVPQQYDYTSPEAPEMPVFAQDLRTNPATLLAALRDAAATVDSSATRYALDCIQLNGSTGTIAATDSRQLLVQTGFQFAWQEELLMRVTNVFDSRELPTDLPVEIGRAEHGVTVRMGQWTIHHELNKEGRYPKLDRTIPSPTAIQTRMQVDAADAKFLTATVGRLPADDQTDRPLTVELNGAIVVRAQKDKQSQMMELLLSRSQRVGPQLRLQTNRAYLTRALELGFTEVGFVDAESPCACRDASRTYVWMLLENKGALESNAEALSIDSMSVPSIGAAKGRGTTRGPARAAETEVAATSTSATQTFVTPVNRIMEHLPPKTTPQDNVNEVVIANPSTSSSADVIEQALELRNQLRVVVQGLTELVGQIRQQRKQSRLMKSTLQSLKQLQLLEA